MGTVNTAVFRYFGHNYDSYSYHVQFLNTAHTMYPHPRCTGISWCQGRADSRGALGSAQGMGGGGDTKMVAVVAGRRRWGWYGDGGGSCTERAMGVVQRWRRQWHGDGSSGGTEMAAAVACRWRQRWHVGSGGGGM